jgi:hypothetical protein
MHSQNLKICHWNANSISGKVIEFYEYLIEEKIDIACLNETCLKPHMNLRKHPEFEIVRLANWKAKRRSCNYNKKNVTIQRK